MSLALGGPGSAGAILKAVREGIDGFQELAIAVSYVQMSGWRLLQPLLGKKSDKVRLLCTDQLGITDPAAVRAIQRAGISVHAYTGAGVYHPKVYIASRPGQASRWVSGSANLSESALQSSVEAASAGDDESGAALAWFNKMFATQSQPFDDARLSALEAAFAARIKGNLSTVRATPAAVAATQRNAVAETVEAAFGSLPDIVVPLNADKAGNNVRTLSRIREILNDPAQLKGKALSEFKLIGLARDGGYTTTGQKARGKSLEAIAAIWMSWLKHASPGEVATANPSGRLARARVAFDTFWSFPQEVRDFFLQNATKPTGANRPLLQTIELLANSGRRIPGLTLEDVRTLSKMLGATEALPRRLRRIIQDYLENKGTRGWSEPDRAILLDAWRKA